MAEDRSQSAEELLARWEQWIAWTRKAHEEASRWATLKNTWVGYPAAALSAIVGTAVFASLAKDDVPIEWRIAAIVMSFAAAGLSAIQTRAAFLEQSEQHRVAAANYQNLILDIAQIRAQRMSDAEAKESVTSVKKRFQELNTASPRLPKHAQRKAGQPPPEVS